MCGHMHLPVNASASCTCAFIQTALLAHLDFCGFNLNTFQQEQPHIPQMANCKCARCTISTDVSIWTQNHLIERVVALAPITASINVVLFSTDCILCRTKLSDSSRGEIKRFLLYS